MAMAIPPLHAGPHERPQNHTVVAAEALAYSGQRPAGGVEPNRRLHLILSQALPPRFDASSPQMLRHRLPADVPPLCHDAHVVAVLVLLHHLLGLGGRQAALSWLSISRGSGLRPSQHLRQRNGQAPELGFPDRALSC